MIGCSGGGGHVAAIQGLYSYFKKRFGNDIVFPEYDVVSYANKNTSPMRNKITHAVGVMHAPVVGIFARGIVSLSPLPVLPDKNALSDEINSLSLKEEKTKKRKYVDMLLDVYPAGYESAAAWNVLQRNDKTEQLAKLIALQKMSDADNYAVTYNHYLTTLKTAAQQGVPYTEVISTQAMALPALCDAVKDYNKWISDEQQNAPDMCIHQYLTDIPTAGAVHFFNALAMLTPEQQSQMKLYGVGMSNEIIQHFFPGENHFSSLCNIPIKENPMVREGFCNPVLDNSACFHQEVILQLADAEGFYTVNIKPHEQIASIMLGSQAGNDTYEYIETLLVNGMDKVFIFGGLSNRFLKGKIEKLIERHCEYKDRIISLGNQGDEQIASLMTRSNMVIIRGGGLSTMEQLAMNHNKEQTVLIHHANSAAKELTSGIPWEDANVRFLLDELTQQGVHCEKTTPERAARHIAEGRLIAAVKRLGANIDTATAIQHIKSLDDDGLKICVDALQLSESKLSTSLPEELTRYFRYREQSAKTHLDFINDKLAAARDTLTTVIRQEIGDAGGEEQEGDLMPTARQSIDYASIALSENPSPVLVSAIDAYKSIQKLQEIIKTEEAKTSADKILIKFREEYAKPETKIVLSVGIIRKIIEAINYILADYFDFFAARLTPAQQVKKYLGKLDKNGKAGASDFSFFKDDAARDGVAASIEQNNSNKNDQCNQAQNQLFL
ncbi:hypothetical protein [Legionella septentrionalis]|uniref:Uncharacterized protein n=2 Tax=Legionella septentrionalis TaxID=2498109 RepID=A0A433JI59_9GAMM|nr:hypothetical protein [Legionella septentrionalis]RUQ84946.1 hypothetical protein EKM59_08185 [Legionella septentrionalis]